MKRQAIWQQALIGALLGLLLFFSQRYKTWYWAADEYMVGQAVSAIIGGVFWYCIAYWLWSRRKRTPRP